jgi:hypothetical protein
MSAPVIATVAFTDSTSNITALLEVATYTTTATGWYQVQFFCSGLTATAANIDVFLRRYATGPGALLGEYGQAAIVKQTAASTTWGNGFAPVFCNSGDILRVALKSSNAGDTTVNGTMEVWDASDANVRKLAGTDYVAGAIPAVAAGAAGGLYKNPTAQPNQYVWIGDGGTNSYATKACYLLNGATPASLPVSGDLLLVDMATAGWVYSPSAGTLADGVLATFANGSVNNGGTVGNYATFSGTCLNSGTVGKYATFNESSHNYSGGTAGDGAILDTDAAQTGTFSGNVYMKRKCVVSGATIGTGKLFYLYDDQISGAAVVNAATGSPNKLLQDAATAAAQPDIDTLTIDGVSKKVVKATTYGFMGALFDTVTTTFPAVMAAAFKKLFNVSTPVNTVNDLATPKTVWEYATRTLTGTALGVGPTAGHNQVDLRYIVFRNGTLGLYARVLDWNGTDLTQAGVTSIAYTIHTLDDDDCRTAVTGHTAVALVKTAVIWDTVQSDGWASNWNFKFIPDISSVAAFAALGSVLVEVTITPASGQKILVRFRNKVI